MKWLSLEHKHFLVDINGELTALLYPDNHEYFQLLIVIFSIKFFILNLSSWKVFLLKDIFDRWNSHLIIEYHQYGLVFYIWNKKWIKIRYNDEYHLERPGFTTLPIMVRTHQTEYTIQKHSASTEKLNCFAVDLRDNLYQIPLPCC